METLQKKKKTLHLPSKITESTPTAAKEKPPIVIAKRYEHNGVSIAVKARAPKPSVMPNPVKAAPKSTPAPQSCVQLNVNNQLICHLVLDQKQQNRLNSLFSGLACTRDLLLKHRPSISNHREAMLFLLQHKKEIDGYLPLYTKDRAIDLIAKMLEVWAGDIPSELAIGFTGCSVTREQQIYLAELGMFQVKESKDLQRFMKTHRYDTTFTLVQDKQYRVEMTLELRNKQVLPKQAPERAEAKRVPHQATVEIIERKALAVRKHRVCLSDLKNMYGLSDRVLTALGTSTVIRDKSPQQLENHAWVPVYSGGLPGLGKRSR